MNFKKPTMYKDVPTTTSDRTTPDRRYDLNDWIEERDALQAEVAQLKTENDALRDSVVSLMEQRTRLREKVVAAHAHFKEIAFKLTSPLAMASMARGGMDICERALEPSPVPSVSACRHEWFTPEMSWTRCRFCDAPHPGPQAAAPKEGE